MDTLLAEWNAYLEWFKTEHQSIEDPVTDMPIALAQPSFEGFMEWYAGKDDPDFTRKVKDREMDVKPYMERKKKVKKGKSAE